MPIGDIELIPEVAEDVQGHDILIAGVRSEHFEDAAMLDETRKAEGLSFKARTLASA